MRKLKKVLCFTIIVSMLGMTACGTTSDEAKDNDSATEAVETQEETEAEAQETTGDVADTEMEDTGTSEETESSSGYYINLDKITEIEEKDDFDLIITGKEVQRDAISGVSLQGNDVCTFTIQNNGTETAKNITIYIVGYKDDYSLCKVSKDYSVSLSSDAAKFVQAFVTNDTTIEPGASTEISIQCDASDFSGVKGIVESYEAGEKKENDIVSEWVANLGTGNKPEGESQASEDTDDGVDRIDFDALDEIEAKDDFEVKVEKVTFEKNAYDTTSLVIGDDNGLGLDACISTIKNNGQNEVSEFQCYCVGYGEDDTIMQLSSNLTIVINGEKYVQVLSAQDADIAPGQAKDFSIKCSMDTSGLKGARMIVASYKDKDGNEYKNPLAEEWYKKVRAGKTTTLD